MIKGSYISKHKRKETSAVMSLRDNHRPLVVMLRSMLRSNRRRESADQQTSSLGRDVCVYDISFQD
jgi:hypothetical protein